MKKALFYIAVSLLLLPMAICLVLLLMLVDISTDFQLFSGSCMMAGVELINIKYALRPNKAVVNPVKSMYHRMNKANAYRIRCIVIFVVFLFIGACTFVRWLCF